MGRYEIPAEFVHVRVPHPSRVFCERVGLFERGQTKGSVATAPAIAELALGRADEASAPT
jgi:hypothetical protein